MKLFVCMGRLTQMPELKTTTNRIAVTSFSVAVPRAYDREKTDFINCVAWKSTAEFICKYFQKGDLVLLSGSMEQRHCLDKQSNKRFVMELRVERAEFTGKRTKKQESAPSDEASESNLSEGITAQADEKEDEFFIF